MEKFPHHPWPWPSKFQELIPEGLGIKVVGYNPALKEIAEYYQI